MLLIWFTLIYLLELSYTDSVEILRTSLWGTQPLTDVWYMQQNCE